MKPLKSLTAVANWLMRISIVVFIVVHYYNDLKQIDIKHLSLNILAIILFSLFGLLLFIGGFRSKAGLTVISGLIISIISLFFIYQNYNGVWLDLNMAVYIFPFSVGIYFLANGNK